MPSNNLGGLVVRIVLLSILVALFWVGGLVTVASRWAAVSEGGEMPRNLLLGTAAVVALPPLVIGIVVWTRRRARVASYHRAELARSMPHDLVLTVEALPPLMQQLNLLRAGSTPSLAPMHARTSLTMTVGDAGVSFWSDGAIPQRVVLIPHNAVKASDTLRANLPKPIALMPTVRYHAVRLTVEAASTAVHLLLAVRDLEGGHLRATEGQAAVVAAAIGDRLQRQYGWNG